MNLRLKQVKYISSKQNPNYKQVLKLLSKRGRNKSGQYIVEGYKECNFAMRTDVETEALWISEQRIKNYKECIQKFKGPNVYKVSNKLFEKLSYRNTTEGILCVCNKYHREIKSAGKKAKSIILVLDNISKPGNIGALLRTADAVGATGVIIAEQDTDMYNQSVIRSSVGTFFTIPWFCLTSKETFKHLKENDIKIVSADPAAKSVYFNRNLPKKMALVVGNEHKGLSKFWKEKSDILINVPMLGFNDSLNVSVSCGIIAYEWLRQSRT